MRFVKMHGLGNDYVFVDTSETPVADPVRLAREVSDRHFGIGGDGLILIGPPERDLHGTMRIFNADGSEAEMCGNGIRCVAKYLFDAGRSDGNVVRIGTRNGPYEIRRLGEKYRVGMGSPRLAPGEIPAHFPGKERVVMEPLEVVVNGERRTLYVTCVSVGNPHCVVAVEDLDGLEIETLGPALERHEAFPARTNVEFVKVLSREHLRQRTWERGSGETLACGTGATAAVVAMHLAGMIGRQATVHLTGGDLEVEWDDEDRLWMTGPAAEVFRGEYLGGG